MYLYLFIYSLIHSFVDLFIYIYFLDGGGEGEGTHIARITNKCPNPRIVPEFSPTLQEFEGHWPLPPSHLLLSV